MERYSRTSEGQFCSTKCSKDETRRNISRSVADNTAATGITADDNDDNDIDDDDDNADDDDEGEDDEEEEAAAVERWCLTLDSSTRHMSVCGRAEMSARAVAVASCRCSGGGRTSSKFVESAGSGIFSITSLLFSLRAISLADPPGPAASGSAP